MHFVTGVSVCIQFGLHALCHWCQCLYIVWFISTLSLASVPVYSLVYKYFVIGVSACIQFGLHALCHWCQCCIQFGLHALCHWCQCLYIVWFISTLSLVTVSVYSLVYMHFTIGVSVCIQFGLHARCHWCQSLYLVWFTKALCHLWHCLYIVWFTKALCHWWHCLYIVWFTCTLSLVLQYRKVRLVIELTDKLKNTFKACRHKFYIKEDVHTNFHCIVILVHVFSHASRWPGIWLNVDFILTQTCLLP